MKYVKLTSTIATEWRSLRDQTLYPEIPHIYGATSEANRILAGNTAKAIETDFYVYQANVTKDGQLRAQVGDKWWKVYEANGQALPADKPKWVAEIHLGKRWLNVEVIEVPEPTPTLEPKQVTSITIEGSPVVTLHFSDGTNQTLS